MQRTIQDKTPDTPWQSSLSDRDFRRLRRCIYNECGINLPDYKKTLVESRLHKRIRILKMSSLSDYCNYLFSSQGIKNELNNLIDAITTNKTDFFREPDQFDYLTREVLPELISTKGAGMRKTLSLWSAGCSSGEEPYTIAMVLSDFSERLYGNCFDFRILATDISLTVLKQAKIGIYGHDHIAPVPMHMRSKYLLKGKKNRKDFVRIAPDIRKLVTFSRLNFMEEHFILSEPADIIFCRNVIIYFNRQTQEQVLTRICSNLRPGGYMFLGHSETLNQLSVPLVPVIPTIFRKPV
ncbi:MAG: protein-glutamate O-methyltransferase [Nitrospiraceae bacterium]|nr:MAG: protein-glutamate O-methyltransferase [Nitrospiraceae bacterium]